MISWLSCLSSVVMRFDREEKKKKKKMLIESKKRGCGMRMGVEDGRGDVVRGFVKITLIK